MYSVWVHKSKEKVNSNYINPYPLVNPPPCFSRVANKGGGNQNIGRRRRKISGVFRSFAVGNRPETIDFEQKSCSADLYFKIFSPAALLKPPKSSILVKSPPQAEKILGLRPTFG